MGEEWVNPPLKKLKRQLFDVFLYVRCTLVLVLENADS